MVIKEIYFINLLKKIIKFENISINSIKIKSQILYYKK